MPNTMKGNEMILFYLLCMMPHSTTYNVSVKKAIKLCN